MVKPNMLICLEKAQQQINAEKAQALSEIKQVVVDLTVSASEKLSKRI